MTDLDNEFERFKSNLDAEITAWLKLPDTKSKSRSKHIARLQKLRQQLLQDPRLRESFVRDVFYPMSKISGHDCANVNASRRHNLSCRVD